MAGDDGFLDHIPALAAAALAAVGVSVGLSYFGVAGTLIGLTVGTIASGALAWWVERMIRRASARAKALAAARKRQGRELSPEETQFISAVSDEHHRRKHGRIPWQAAALGLSAVFVVAGAILVVIALGAGRPVGAIAHPAAHSRRHVAPPSPTFLPSVPATSTAPTLVPTTIAPTPSTVAPSPSLSTVEGGTPTVPPSTVPAVTASPSAS